MEFLFWTSIFVILYSYIGYPVFLFALSKTKKRAITKPDKISFPGVSVIIPVHNEERIIEQKIENILREISKDFDCKAAELIHPVRIGVSGSTVGPSLFKMLEILGKERVIKRLEKMVKYLKNEYFK